MAVTTSVPKTTMSKIGTAKNRRADPTELSMDVGPTGGDERRLRQKQHDPAAEDRSVDLEKGRQRLSLEVRPQEIRPRESEERRGDSRHGHDEKEDV